MNSAKSKYPKFSDSIHFRPITPIETKYAPDILIRQRPTHRPIWEFDPFVYRVGDLNCPNPNNPMTLLHEVCMERGWKEYGQEEEKLIKGSLMGWNMWWRTTFSAQNHRSLFTWQFTNYIPRAIGFCNKEYLARYISFMQEHYGSIFDFSPITYILPKDFWKLNIEHSRRSQLAARSDLNWLERARNLVPVPEEARQKQELEKPLEAKNFTPVWISKPIGRSQGKGIVLFNEIDPLVLNAGDHHGTLVIQEYISRPLLVGNHKFDLRLYVCVTSTQPLCVYVFQEGLTRFATEKYDLARLGNTFSHLTNASLNKLSPTYGTDKADIGHGCKWTLRKLRQYLAMKNLPDWYMWQRIISIIVLTLIGEANRSGYIPNAKNCFEFLGYDILLDEDLRPWLLEVNHAPGLNADCDVDYEVKVPMLHDLFNLLGLPYYVGKDKASGEDGRNISTRGATPVSGYYGSSDSRPNTVGGIGSPKKPLASSRYDPRRSLRNRLMDLTAIYTQSLSPYTDHMKVLPNPPKQKFLKKRNPNASQATSNKPKSVDSGPSKGGRPYKHRDWITNPIKKCGQWVRVFPFDGFTHEQSRGKLGVDIKLLVNHVYCHLKTARQITLDHPGCSDAFYSSTLKKSMKMESEIWLPPK